MGVGEAGEKLRRSTVRVRSRSDVRGSGVIWDQTGTIVTNAHVVGTGNLTVELWDGRTLDAFVERRDGQRDLAVLRIDATSLEPARSAEADTIRTGELVIAVGNPLGFTGALSTGVVHGFGPVSGVGGGAFIQTTARLAPGNSGGPLANIAGNVIGINTAVIFGGLGLAIPAAAVRRLLTAGAPTELGIAVRPVRIRPPHQGIALLVLEVARGSAAEYLSMRAGDIILGINGRKLNSPDDLGTAHDQIGESSIKIQFLRDRETAEREVTKRPIRRAAA